MGLDALIPGGLPPKIWTPFGIISPYVGNATDATISANGSIPNALQRYGNLTINAGVVLTTSGILQIIICRTLTFGSTTSRISADLNGPTGGAGATTNNTLAGAANGGYGCIPGILYGGQYAPTYNLNGSLAPGGGQAIPGVNGGNYVAGSWTVPMMSNPLLWGWLVGGGGGGGGMGGSNTGGSGTGGVNGIGGGSPSTTGGSGGSVGVSGGGGGSGVAGGGGGGGGAAVATYVSGAGTTGNGGNGGGCIFILCDDIQGSAGILSANGGGGGAATGTGTGGAGANGGGGGGGGGGIVIVTRALSVTPAFQVAGSPGGAGVTTGGYTGGNGGTGGNGLSQVFRSQ